MNSKKEQLFCNEICRKEMANKYCKSKTQKHGVHFPYEKGDKTMRIWTGAAYLVRRHVASAWEHRIKNTTKRFTSPRNLWPQITFTWDLAHNKHELGLMTIFGLILADIRAYLFDLTKNLQNGQNTKDQQYR